MKNVNSVNDSWYGVNGRARIYWDSAFRSGENRGTYGYYLVEDGATQGSTGANISNMYIQDQWRIHPRLTLNIGIRTEQETIPVRPCDQGLCLQVRLGRQDLPAARRQLRRLRQREAQVFRRVGASI
ncbi:MAG: hypothetical protein R2748_23500 [Bryobacterales bacterium]